MIECKIYDNLNTLEKEYVDEYGKEFWLLSPTEDIPKYIKTLDICYDDISLKQKYYEVINNLYKIHPPVVCQLEEEVDWVDEDTGEVYKKTISVNKELQTFCYELVTSYPEEYLTKIYACDNITVVNEDSERLFSIINSKEVQ